MWWLLVLLNELIYVFDSIAIFEKRKNLRQYGIYILPHSDAAACVLKTTKTQISFAWIFCRLTHHSKRPRLIFLTLAVIIAVSIIIIIIIIIISISGSLRLLLLSGGSSTALPGMRHVHTQHECPRISS